MALSQYEFNIADRIINYVVKHNMGSLQTYRADEEYRCFTMIAKGLTYNEKRYCDTVYVNLPKFTEWQYKNFVKRSLKELPGKCFVETYQTGQIIRIGFK